MNDGFDELIPDPYSNPFLDQIQTNPTHLHTPSRLRYVRVKDVGTRLPAGEQRNKRIVEIAKPLPEENRLPGRGIYWFVTTLQADITFEDKGLFQKKNTAELIDYASRVVYYLNQIDFQHNKNGTLLFKFADGYEEKVICYSTLKSKKTSPGDYRPIEESQSAIQEPPQNNNNNNSFHAFQSLDQPPRTEEITNPVQQPSTFANLILLVPNEQNYIDIAEKALNEIGMVKQVSSESQQRLYSEEDTVNYKRHILIFPYGDLILSRVRKLQDYMPYTNEVVLLMENEVQDNNMHYIKQVNNFGTPDKSILFLERTPNFNSIELDYNQLKDPIQIILSIPDLRGMLGGATCKETFNHEQLAKFIVTWIPNLDTKKIPLNIYLCFKYEKNIKTFTECAAITLNGLGIESEPFVAKGSVLVYIRCPSYIPWYILQRKNAILAPLVEAGLTEIYECFVDDIEASIQRPDNEEFIDELFYLKEQMISDGIPYGSTKKRFDFQVVEVHKKLEDGTQRTKVKLRRRITSKMVFYNDVTLQDSPKEVQNKNKAMKVPEFFNDKFFRAALGESPLYLITKNHFKVVVKMANYKSEIEFMDVFSIDGEKILIDQATRNKIAFSLKPKSKRSVTSVLAILRVAAMFDEPKSKGAQYTPERVLKLIGIEEDLTFHFPLIEVLVNDKPTKFNKFTVKAKTRLSIVKHIGVFLKAMVTSEKEKQQELFDALRVSCNFGNSEMKNEHFEMFFDVVDHTIVYLSDDPTTEEDDSHEQPMEVSEDKGVENIVDVMDELLFTAQSFEEVSMPNSHTQPMEVSEDRLVDLMDDETLFYQPLEEEESSQIPLSRRFSLADVITLSDDE